MVTPNTRKKTCPITDGFVSHTSGSDMNWPGIETGSSRWEASDRGMNNDTADMASEARRSRSGFYRTEYFISQE